MPAAHTMMLSKLNIVDALSSSKDPTPAAEEERSEKEIEKTRIAALQKRIKVLLKEAENKKCSECRSDKPKWMSLLQTPLDYNTQELGVFCCNNCQPYHLALGEDLCTIKSLKNPEEWTEEDVVTLEKSGNKVVNAIYSSALEGNHTEKHVGSLASKFFVEGKYKNCDYFLEEAYHEQIKLREKLQAEKQEVEITAGPTTDDLLKKALKKQGSIKSLTLEDSDDDEEIEAKGCVEKQSKKTKERGMPNMTKNAIKKLSSARDLMKGILKSDKSTDNEATPTIKQTTKGGNSSSRNLLGEDDGENKPTLTNVKPLSSKNLTRQRSNESEPRPRMTRKARSSRSLMKDVEGETRPRMTRRAGSSRSLLKDQNSINEGVDRRSRLTGRASSSRNLMSASSPHGVEQDEQKPDKIRQRRATRSSSARNLMSDTTTPVKGESGRQRRPRNNTFQRSSTAGPKLGLQRSSTTGAISRVGARPDRLPNEVVNAEEFSELSGPGNKLRIARTRSGQKGYRSRTPLSERVPRGARQNSRSASRGSLKRSVTSGSAGSMKGGSMQGSTNGSAGSQHRSASSLGLQGSFMVECDKPISVDDKSASWASLNSSMSNGHDKSNSQLLESSESGCEQSPSLKITRRSQAAGLLQQSQPGEQPKLFQTFQRTMSGSLGNVARNGVQSSSVGSIASTHSKSSKRSNRSSKRAPENGTLKKKSASLEGEKFRLGASYGSLAPLRNNSHAKLARPQSTTSVPGSACDIPDASRSRGNRAWKSKKVQNGSSEVTAVFKGIVDSGVQIDDPNKSQLTKAITSEKDRKGQKPDYNQEVGNSQKIGQELDDLSFSGACFEPNNKPATQDSNKESERGCNSNRKSKVTPKVSLKLLKNAAL